MQEEDEKRRLSQAKELKEEEECTDPGEDSLHGLPTDEVSSLPTGLLQVLECLGV